MLIAKPVVKNSYWVVTDGQQKVGNVIADHNGYSLILGDQVQHCANTTEIVRDYSIHFENLTNKKKQNDVPYAVWPTTGKTYNNLLDIKRKLHIYTKTKVSTCYYVAGYFAIHMNDEWSTVFSPKYIFVQRYRYSGPYKSREEAQQWIEAMSEINRA